MFDKTSLKRQFQNLPHVSGCYLFKNNNNQLIYIGKAKNLYKRVNSYLNRAGNLKTLQLVNDIFFVDYITTRNEKEALILEQNLIKKHRPKYNILLTDDKRYPYIQVTNDANPQYRYVRKANKDQGKYYGPFPDGTGAREILKLLERIFPLRKCQGNLGHPCLYYHLQQCSGACFKVVPPIYYHNMIEKIEQFFKGNVNEIKKQLVDNMKISAENWQFEAANRIKILLEKIDHFLADQLVEFQDFMNRDFINFIENDNLISVVTLFYRNGKLQAKDEQVLVNNFFDLQDFIRNYCIQLYSKNTLPMEIYLPATVDTKELIMFFPQVKFIHPVKGKKEHILSNAKTNAIYALNDAKNKPYGTNNIMHILGQWLEIPNLNHLEVFDVSNLNQTASVAGMIVYKDGKPSINDYRRYLLDPNLKDDYHRMQEVIYRRYYYLLINKLSLPDLIIVDGGNLQVQAAQKQLAVLNLTIPIVGLVKNKKHETDKIITTDFKAIKIPKTDACFRFLSNLQDQVHNYALRYHKMKRSQSMMNTILAVVPGIGPKLQSKIIAVFPDFDRLKTATYSELKKIIPSKTTHDRLWSMLHPFNVDEQKATTADSDN